MRRLPLALPLSLSLVLLTGCSMFSFHTNIDKENFTEYFKPGTVALVEKAQLEDLNYEVLGTVEAESCQADADQPVPNLGDARTQARRKVADMGVITSYSIHYTKLYDNAGEAVLVGVTRQDLLLDGQLVQQADEAVAQAANLVVAQRRRRDHVITSYSIHYTKLYE